MAETTEISTTVTKAVDSLLKWHKSRSETEKPKLFDDDEFVYLILTLKKIPQNGRVNPHKIPIPHPLFSPSTEQCLIIDDREKTIRLTQDEAEKKIQSESIPISMVLKLSELASNYRAFEEKRKLCNSYDLFFADKTIVPLLPRLLGKQFFKKRKIPVQVDLKKKNWKEQIEKACCSALLFLRTGTCSVLKVAKLSMERDEIVENVVAATEGVVKVFPKKWGVVRSFHVKLLESVALPVYQAAPDVRLKIEGVKDVEDALELAKDAKVGGRGKDGKKSKKGRIHEIKYMDDRMSEDGDDHGGDSDGGVDKVEDDSENDEIESEELVSKKMKKGVKVKKGDSSELGSVKSLKGSAKRKKKDELDVSAVEEGLIKKTEKRKKLSGKDEGLEEKNKKGPAVKAAVEVGLEEKKKGLAVKAAVEEGLIEKSDKRKKLSGKDEGLAEKKKGLAVKAAVEEGLIKKTEKRKKLSGKDEGLEEKNKKGPAVKAAVEVGLEEKKKGLAVKAAVEEGLIEKSDKRKKLSGKDEGLAEKKKGLAVKAAVEEGLIKKTEKRKKLSGKDEGSDKKKELAVKPAVEDLVKKSKDILSVGDKGSGKKKTKRADVKGKKCKKACC